MKPCLCCWSDFEGRGLYCEPCRAAHGGKLAAKDDDGATTCPEAQRTSQAYLERIQAMPATRFRATAVRDDVRDLEAPNTWRGMNR